MNVYKELKEIALLNEKIIELCEKIEQELDIEDLDLRSTRIVRNCEERKGHLYDGKGKKLDNYGLVYDNYYCYQLQGYCEDDFYGRLYYATDENGVFIEIPFQC